MKRISAIAQACLPQKILADVACDHGFIGLQYLQKHQGKKVYAVDININCLRNAIDNIAKYHMEDRAFPMLGDGLTALPADVEVVVLAGVGSHLASEILFGEGIDLSSYHQIVVSVNQKSIAFREALYARGVTITGESLVYEHGKYYEIISFHTQTVTKYPPMPSGSFLMWKDPLYQEYLEYHCRKLADIPHLQELRDKYLRMINHLVSNKMVTQ